MPIYNDNWNVLGLQIPVPERLQERNLATVTINTAGVQAQLRAAFARLDAIVQGPFPHFAQWSAELDTQGRYGYAYTGYKFFLMSGNLRRRTVHEGIVKVRGKLAAAAIVHNEKLYMDIV